MPFLWNSESSQRRSQQLWSLWWHFRLINARWRASYSLAINLNFWCYGNAVGIGQPGLPYPFLFSITSASCGQVAESRRFQPHSQFAWILRFAIICLPSDQLALRSFRFEPYAFLPTGLIRYYSSPLIRILTNQVVHSFNSMTGSCACHHQLIYRCIKRNSTHTIPHTRSISDIYHSHAPLNQSITLSLMRFSLGC